MRIELWTNASVWFWRVWQGERIVSDGFSQHREEAATEAFEVYDRHKEPIKQGVSATL